MVRRCLSFFFSDRLFDVVMVMMMMMMMIHKLLMYQIEKVMLVGQISHTNNMSNTRKEGTGLRR